MCGHSRFICNENDVTLTKIPAVQLFKANFKLKKLAHAELQSNVLQTASGQAEVWPAEVPQVNTHIHCIIWTGEGNFSSCVRNRIVCKNSRMKFEFDQLNDRGTISNLENMHRKDRDSCIIQTHDCGHSDGHCQKSRVGKKESRVPLHPAGLIQVQTAPNNPFGWSLQYFDLVWFGHCTKSMTTGVFVRRCNEESINNLHTQANNYPSLVQWFSAWLDLVKTCKFLTLFCLSVTRKNIRSA